MGRIFSCLIHITVYIGMQVEGSSSAELSGASDSQSAANDAYNNLVYDVRVVSY